MTEPSLRRRRRGPGWVPNQHGAWAMLVVPPVVGALRGGADRVHLLLLVAWLAAYLAYYATGLWLKARRRPRYWPPVRAYGVITAALGAALLLGEPRLLLWAPVYTPLLAVSLWFSWRRRDRSWTNDVVTVVAACLMAVVAFGLGDAGGAGLGRSAGGPGWLPPGASSGEAWLLAGVLLAYFLGTVLYVKSMIRERGVPAVLRASVTYHVVVGVGAWVVSPWLGALFTVLAARALAVPRWWPRATPKALGIGEIVASTALAAILLTLP